MWWGDGVVDGVYDTGQAILRCEFCEHHHLRPEEEAAQGAHPGQVPVQVCSAGGWCCPQVLVVLRYQMYTPNPITEVTINTEAREITISVFKESSKELFITRSDAFRKCCSRFKRFIHYCFCYLRSIVALS